MFLSILWLVGVVNFSFCVFYRHLKHFIFYGHDQMHLGVLLLSQTGSHKNPLCQSFSEVSFLLLQYSDTHWVQNLELQIRQMVLTQARMIWLDWRSLQKRILEDCFCCFTLEFFHSSVVTIETFTCSSHPRITKMF